MDGHGEYYAKQNKPVRGRQIPYNFTYMWNLMYNIKKKKKQTYRESTNICQRKDFGGLIENVKWLRKEKHKYFYDLQ